MCQNEVMKEKSHATFLLAKERWGHSKCWRGVSFEYKRLCHSNKLWISQHCSLIFKKHSPRVCQLPSKHGGLGVGQGQPGASTGPIAWRCDSLLILLALSLTSIISCLSRNWDSFSWWHQTLPWSRRFLVKIALTVPGMYPESAKEERRLTGNYKCSGCGRRPKVHTGRSQAQAGEKGLTMGQSSCNKHPFQ